MENCPPHIYAITAQRDQDLILAVKKKELAGPCSMCSSFYYKMKKVYQKISSKKSREMRALLTTHHQQPKYERVSRPN